MTPPSFFVSSPDLSLVPVGESVMVGECILIGSFVAIAVIGYWAQKEIE